MYMLRSNRLLLLALFFSITFPPLHNTWGDNQYFSADKYESERIEGRDVIKCSGNFIFQKDHVTIYADVAYWDQETKTIDIRKGVRIERRNKKNQLLQHTITTNQLLYHQKSRTAELLGGVTFREGDHILTSEQGFYNEKKDHGWFKGSVHFQSPKEVITCQQLFYNELPSKLRKQHRNLFKKSPQTVYRAEGKVSVQLLQEQVTLYGEEAFFDRDTDQAKVCTSATLKKELDKSSLFLVADEFLLLKTTALPPTLDQKLEKTLPKINKRASHAEHMLQALGDVRMYQEELQGKTKELRYYPGYDRVELIGDPMLWNEDNQFAATAALLFFQKDQIQRIALHPNARILQLDKQKNYNQVKGKNMQLAFTQGALTGIDITGKPESIYYLLEEPESPPTQEDNSIEAASATLSGMNHSWSERVHIVVQDRKVTTIQLMGKTKGMIYPPSAITVTNADLGGFSWQGKERLTEAEIQTRLRPYNQAHR